MKHLAIVAILVILPATGCQESILGPQNGSVFGPPGSFPSGDTPPGVVPPDDAPPGEIPSGPAPPGGTPSGPAPPGIVPPGGGSAMCVLPVSNGCPDTPTMPFPVPTS